MDIAGAEKIKRKNAKMQKKKKRLYQNTPLRMYVRIAVYCTICAPIPSS